MIKFGETNDNLIVKVDRVRNSDEAIAFQELGVNLIGVSLGERDIFDDDRKLSEDQVGLISQSLKSSQLVIDISYLSDETRISRLPKLVEFDYFQVNEYKISKFLDRNPDIQNKRAIFSPVCLSHDEDPSWLFDGLDKKDYSYFQLDVLGDIDQSWNFLASTAMEEPDDVQIEDISKLTIEYPSLLTIDFSVDNINDVLNSFPHICGISFTLGQSPHRNDIHCFEYSEVIQVLKVLRGSH
jgi:hypothetical protein